ncbi:hypothetical protein [Schumannella sp. 10F1B-5-1]|uniref:hypothetical protein n=1 Tax=Schumannella sp. 10F1B-5-1 TaxID=2590780 RepID=UPI001131579F|nr:hypothetical protein [Schumannella sp. 10F1B-5-1]TPW72323.1 hypothetical protein FJ658_08625 [Schumannella sp. 10F1B-5-1]
MSEQISIDAETLLAQARDSERAAEAIAHARGAVGSMDLGGGAFGIMCAFLVPIAQSVTAMADRTLVEAQSMLEREAEALRATVDDFDRLEAGAVEGLRALGAGMSDS